MLKKPIFKVFFFLRSYRRKAGEIIPFRVRKSISNGSQFDNLIL